MKSCHVISPVAILALVLGGWQLLANVRAESTDASEALVESQVASAASEIETLPEGGTAGGDHGTICGSPVGEDLIVGDIFNIANYPLQVNTIDAFSFGTSACNIGDVIVDWYDNNNQHPVIGQNMFRLKDGRFEQIGQSWLKHGFAAAQLNGCGCGCQFNGGGFDTLGVGCSDPYDAQTNGAQGGLGPKFEVNPHTGFFPHPFTGENQTGGVTYKRLQVRTQDLSPSLNVGAQYFVEVQYVHPDDSAAENQDNNSSYRQITITGTNEFSATFAGETQREHPAIHAWRHHDPEVVEADIRVPHDGLLILAAKATELPGGMWHYEYALQNLNADRAVGSFAVPVVTPGVVQNIEFHDVEYHSGEPFVGNDWVGVASGGEVTWSTDAYSTNPNANALRWGTLYNFRFDSDLSPAMGTVRIGLFKPGTPNLLTALTIVPNPAAGDCNVNALPDYCDVSCDGGSGDECQVVGCGQSADCNGNALPDECDVASTFSFDCDSNIVPDECQPNFDGDPNPDTCDHDTDDDGVNGPSDVCDFTPLGSLIQTDGSQVGDADSDCTIDLSDYAVFSGCLSAGGPGSVASNNCRGEFDSNGDHRIDLVDVAYFQGVFAGGD